MAPSDAAWYRSSMTTTTDKLIERLSALPEDDRAAVAEDVLGYVDELIALRNGLREAEDDVTAGRISPATDVFDRLLGKYAV